MHSGGMGKKTMVREKKIPSEEDIHCAVLLFSNYWATVYMCLRLHVLMFFFIKVIAMNIKNHVFLPLC